MSDNIVGILREKTEEADLDTILKSTMGGYSRKSVQEYLSMIRQQQRDLQQNFSQEIERMQEDRERLLRELTESRERAGEAEEATSLREKVVALEKDMDEAVDRIHQDSLLLEQNRQELEEQRLYSENTSRERDLLRTLLESAEEENRKLKEELEQREAAETAAMEEEPPIPELPVVPKAPATPAYTVPAVPPYAAPTPIYTAPTYTPPTSTCATPAYASPTYAPAMAAEPTPRVAELYNRSDMLQSQLALREAELERVSRRMESLLRQEQNLYQALDECRAELQERRDQSEWMEIENDELSCRLSEQIEQNVALSRELSRTKAMNASLQRKLDAALAQLARQTAPAEPETGGELHDLSAIS